MWARAHVSSGASLLDTFKEQPVSRTGHALAPALRGARAALVVPQVPRATRAPSPRPSMFRPRALAHSVVSRSPRQAHAVGRALGRPRRRTAPVRARGGAAHDRQRAAQCGALGVQRRRRCRRALARPDRRRGALAERPVLRRNRLVGAENGAARADARPSGGLRQVRRARRARRLGPAARRGRSSRGERRGPRAGGRATSRRRAAASSRRLSIASSGSRARRCARAAVRLARGRRARRTTRGPLVGRRARRPRRRGARPSSSTRSRSPSRPQSRTGFEVGAQALDELTDATIDAATARELGRRSPPPTACGSARARAAAAGSSRRWRSRWTTPRARGTSAAARAVEQDLGAVAENVEMVFKLEVKPSEHSWANWVTKPSPIVVDALQDPFLAQMAPVNKEEVALFRP